MDYGEYREQYEERHRASVPVKKQAVSEYPMWLYWGVFFMFVCAAVLSGVHTIPTVYRTIEVGGLITPLVRDLAALSSFVAVELAIFVSYYATIRGSKWSVWLVLVTSFTVAIVSNLQSVSRALAGDASGVDTIIVVLALGVGMPMIALMAGKLFADMHKSQRMAMLRADQEYIEACRQFDAAVLEAFNAFEKKSDRRLSASVRPLSTVSGQADTDNGHATGHGYTKRTDARDIVRRYLQENPGAENSSVRDLAGRLNVGKTTVADVLQEFRGRTELATNGHHEVLANG